MSVALPINTICLVDDQKFMAVFVLADLPQLNLQYGGGELESNALCLIVILYDLGHTRLGLNR